MLLPSLQWAQLEAFDVPSFFCERVLLHHPLLYMLHGFPCHRSCNLCSQIVSTGRLFLFNVLLPCWFLVKNVIQKVWLLHFAAFCLAICRTKQSISLNMLKMVFSVKTCYFGAICDSRELNRCCSPGSSLLAHFPHSLMDSSVQTHDAENNCFTNLTAFTVFVNFSYMNAQDDQNLLLCFLHDFQRVQRNGTMERGGTTAHGAPLNSLDCWCESWYTLSSALNIHPGE